MITKEQIKLVPISCNNCGNRFQNGRPCNADIPCNGGNSWIPLSQQSDLLEEVRMLRDEYEYVYNTLSSPVYEKFIDRLNLIINKAEVSNDNKEE